jgi:hypothetical protein
MRLSVSQITYPGRRVVAMIDVEREFRARGCEVPPRSDLENRIRELENEVSFLKGKIEGMRSVPLPVPAISDPPSPGQIWEPIRWPSAPSTKKPWEPPYEITCKISGDVTGSIGLELE